MENSRSKKKAGIIAGGVVALGIAAGGITVGVLSATAKVTIKFDSDGANTINETTIKKGAGINNLPIPFKKGYKFLGWYLNADRTVKADKDTKFKSDTILYAKWEENLYSINFVDELDIASKEDYPVLYGKNANIQDLRYINDLFTFEGWSETKNGEIVGKRNNGQTEYKMDVYGSTLYAVWKSADVDVYIEGSRVDTVKALDSYVLPVPTVEQLSNLPGFSGYRIEVRDDRTQNVIFTEDYLPGQKIKIKPQGVVKEANGFSFNLTYLNLGESKVVKYVDYDGREFQVEESSQNEVFTPSKIAGYSFDGWYRNQNFNDKDKVTTLASIQEDRDAGLVVLYAKRNPEQVTVNLNFGDATELSATNKQFNAYVGEEITLPYARNFIKADTDFIGWKLNGNKIGNGGGVYTIKPTDGLSINLEAMWGSPFNLLSFNLNGGIGDIQSGDYREIGTYKLPENAPKKLGYTFKGWYTEPLDYSLVDESWLYKPNTDFNLTKRTILYAIYQPKQYQIVYDLDYNNLVIDNTNPIRFGSKVDIIGASSITAKPGYKLKEWQIEYSDGRIGRIDADRQLTLGSDIIDEETDEQIKLTAVWEERNYQLVLDNISAGVTSINILVNGKNVTYNVSNGVINVPYNAKIEIDATQFQAKQNHSILGVVLSKIGNTSFLPAKNPQDGAYGTSENRINKNNDNKIIFNLTGEQIANSLENTVVAFHINEIPNKINVVYNAGNGTLKNGDFNSTVYYTILKENSIECLNGSDVVNAPAGEYFRYWSVTNKVGTEFKFEGNGVKVGDETEYNKKIFGIDNIEDLLNANNEIELKAVYKKAVTATVNLSTYYGSWENNKTTQTVVFEDITKLYGEPDFNLNVNLSLNSEGEIVINGQTIVSPIREGYTLNGYLLNGSSDDVTNSLSIINANNTDLVFNLSAVWSPKVYNIEIIQENGTTKPSTLTITTDQLFILNDLGKPEPLENKVFVGYSLSANGSTIDTLTINSTNNNFNLVESGTLKLYEIWINSVERTAVFHPNAFGSSQVTIISEGSSFVNQDCNIVKSVGGTEVEITLPEASRNGYTFEGWYKVAQPTLSDRPVTEVKLSISNSLPQEFYAWWKAVTYRVEFSNYTGDITKTITFDANSLLLSDAPIVEVAGKNFMGWSLSEGGEIVSEISLNAENFNLIQNETLTLYPVYMDKQMQYVSFNFGEIDADIDLSDFVNSYGADVSLESKQVTLPTVEEINAKVTKTGYAFKGFSLSVNGSIVSSVVIEKEATTQVEVFAIWEAINYKIAFYKNNGTTDKIEVDSLYNSSATINDRLTEEYRSLTRENYYFIGWSSNKTADTAEYTNTSNIEHNVAQNLEFYAVWKECFVTINFDIGSATGTTPTSVTRLMKTGEVVSHTGKPEAYQIWENDAEFELTGYNFGGWEYVIGSDTFKIRPGESLSSDTLNTLVTDINKAKNTILTLTAIWEQQDVELFDADGNYTGGDRESLHIPATWNGNTIEAEIPYITVGKGVTALNARAIKSNSLSELVLSSDVVSIAAAAIETSNLTSFAIGENVTITGGNPVIKNVDVGVLNSFVVHPDNTSFKSVDGCLFNKAGNTLFAVPHTYMGEDGVVDFTTNPALIGVTELKDYSLNGASLVTSIIMSDNIVNVGSSVFAELPNLTNLKLSSNINANNNSFGKGLTSLATITGGNSSSVYAENNAIVSYRMLIKVGVKLDAYSNSTAASISKFAFEGSRLSRLELDGTQLSTASEYFIDLKDTLQYVSLGIYNYENSNELFKNFKQLVSAKFSNSSFNGIGNSCFEGCSNLVSVDAPSVTTINARAFANSGLKHYTFRGDETIASDAFTGVSLSSVQFNSNGLKSSTLGGMHFTNIDTITYNYATVLGNDYVKFKSAKHIVFGDNVGTVKKGEMFTNNNNVTSFYISKNVAGIETETFTGCNRLIRFYIDPQHSFYESSKNSNALITPTGILIAACRTSVITSNVTSIAQGAFKNLAITSIEIPDSVTTIADEAFYGTDIESIVLPKNLSSLGYRVFAFCRNLSRMEVASGGTTSYRSENNGIYRSIGLYASCKTTVVKENSGVEDYAFYGVNIKEVNLSRIAIGDSAFSFSDLETLTITYSGEYNIELDPALANCLNLRKLTINAPLMNIPTDNFFKQNCPNLEYVDLSNVELTDLHNMFQECSNLKTIKLPTVLDTLNNEEFLGCFNLESIEIPDNITSIPTDAFRRCYNLQKISTSVNSNLNSISFGAFSHCGSITDIHIYSDELTIDSSAFDLELENLKNITLPIKVNCMELANHNILSNNNIENLTFISNDKLYRGSAEIADFVERIQQERNNQNINIHVTIPDILESSLIDRIIRIVNENVSLYLIDNIYSSDLFNYNGFIGKIIEGKAYFTEYQGDENFGITFPAYIMYNGQKIKTYGFQDDYFEWNGVSPSSITFLGDVEVLSERTFNGSLNTSNLKELTFMGNIEAIADSFVGIDYLERINFYGSVENIARGALKGVYSEKIYFENVINLLDESFSGVSGEQLIINGTDIHCYPQAFRDCNFNKIVINGNIIVDGSTSEFSPSESILIEGNIKEIYINGNITFNGYGVLIDNCSSLELLSILGSVSIGNEELFPEYCYLLGANIGYAQIHFYSIPITDNNYINTFLDGGNGAVVDIYALEYYEYWWGNNTSYTTYRLNGFMYEVGIINGMKKIEYIKLGGAAILCGPIDDQIIPQYILTTTGECLRVVGLGLYDNGYHKTQIYSENLVIPNFINKISINAFEGSSIQSLTLSNGIRIIEEYAFINCGIARLTLPYGIERIMYGAFADNTFTSITIPSSVNFIGSKAFATINDTLEEVTFESINPPECDGTIFGTTKPRIRVPVGCGNAYRSALPEYKDCIYEDATIASTTITNGVLSGVTTQSEDIYTIGDYQFKIVDNNYKTVVLNAYTGTDSYLTMPSYVVINGATYTITDLNNAFANNTKLTSITLPKSLKTIMSEAFSGCTNLTSISLPKSVTVLGENAFMGCSKLKTVTLNNIVPPQCVTPFDSEPTIRVPKGSGDKYKQADGWKDYADSIIEY